MREQTERQRGGQFYFIGGEAEGGKERVIIKEWLNAFRNREEPTRGRGGIGGNKGKREQRQNCSLKGLVQLRTGNGEKAKGRGG